MRLRSAIALGAFNACLSFAAQAAIVEGTFTAIVSEASDPGQASFGRDPSTWVGKTVMGSFRYDVDTSGISDLEPANGAWTYADSSRNTRWAYVTASIDGVDFATSARATPATGTVGGTIQIWDGTFFGLDWYSVQDAYISSGRSVIGFDVFGPASLFSYAGTGGSVDFEFDPTQPGVTSMGLIEDLAISSGVTVRSGLIRFRLTSLSFGKSTEVLIEELLEAVSAVGPGKSLANKIAIMRAYYEAGDAVAACAMLTDFRNQVRAQSGKKLSEDLAAELTHDAQVLAERLECE